MPRRWCRTSPRLGISHVYASPITTARAGSTHGYDVVDPTQSIPSWAARPALRRLVDALRARGLGLILDIVPNHMAADAGECLVGRRAAPRPGQPLRRASSTSTGTPTTRCCCRSSAGRSTRSWRPASWSARATPCRYFERIACPLPTAGSSDQHWRLALVAHRRRPHQLAALLRHQRAGLPADGGARGLRGGACAGRCASMREGLIDGLRIDHVDGLPIRPPIAASCASGSIRQPGRPGSWSRRSCCAARRCRPTGAATAPPATTSWTRSSALQHDPAGASRRWPRPGRGSAAGRPTSRRGGSRRARRSSPAAFGAQLEGCVGAFDRARRDLGRRRRCAAR